MGFEEDPWETAGSMQIKFYDQRKNKLFSTFFPTNEEKFGIGLLIDDKFKDSCSNGALVVADCAPDGGLPCPSGSQLQVHTPL